MLQKELTKRLKARYDTKMDGKDGWRSARTRERRGYYSKC